MTLYLGKQQVAMTMNHVDESAVAQKVDKVTTPNIVYGTDSNGDQTTYNKNSFGQVDDVQVNGTSVINNKVASITLGTMANENTTNYYTKTELNGKLNSAMHFKGTKARVADLPSSGQEVGDMWNVQSTGANYAWDGSSWDKLSENIDLSGLQPNLTSSNAGTGISITGSGSNVVISNTQTSAEWGNITGTLSNQTDLQNALNDKQNESTAVNYDNITNCITYIPQDIKLELNNDGKLKLKSGSKVYISTNGTFNAVTISGDKTGGGSLWTTAHNRELFVVVNADNNNIATIPVEQTYSQDTAPTTFLAGYGGWFDTANNIVKYTIDGGTTWRVCSLPICIGRPGETNVGWNGYLDQVFNGFGYIGSTVFALPGVKGLIPNGRNTDGSLKNKEYVTSTVVTRTFTTQTYESCIGFRGIGFGTSNIIDTSYNEKENFVYTGVNKWDCGLIGTCTLTSGKISNWNPKTAFHAVDYNDFSDLKDDVEANTNTLGYKQDEATAVNYDNITNCITEIPQDIKLEINSNGIAVLKAGSKVYVPNGFTGTTPKFDVVVVGIDTELPTNWQVGSSTTGFIYWRANESTQYYIPLDRCTSGTTVPTATNTQVWYDTTNNLIKRYYNGSLDNSDLSLPIAIVTVTSSGTITSIDQVFNGFGYMGNTIYMLPGVKGLLANGFNEDGSLKNYTWTNSSVKIKNIKSSEKDHKYITTNFVASIIGTIYDQISSDTQPTVPTTSFWYIPKDNLNARVLSDGTANIPYTETAIGRISLDSTGKVLSLTPNTVFHAVDYNDVYIKTDVDNKLATKANTDMDNLTNTGQNIANWSSNVTNCITEIPQNIKLEINSNGKAVLKAGSKVYVPNGFTGTTPKFDVFTVDRDVTYNFQSSQNGKYLLANHNNGQNAGWSKANLAGSGTSTESNASFYYRTDDNKVYYLNDSSGSIYTLPLAIVNLTNGVATIDQVFNGFGYIGSTVFALPGVKGLIPNGRNTDGTLKNIEISFSKVVTLTNNVVYSGDIAITLDYFDLAQGNIYNEKDNRNYLSDGVTPFNRCIAGKFVKGTNGVITSLTPKTAFRALDYNDSSTISGWSMPSSRYIDLTLGATGSTYTAPANGWVLVGKQTNGTSLQNIYIKINGFPCGICWTSGGYNAFVYAPVCKGQIFGVNYTAGGETQVFRFVYAVGEGEQ